MKINGFNLMAFANGLSSGHIKNWKANGMIVTLTQMPMIVDDEDRLRKYVRQCLEMEGFNLADCDKIVEYLTANQ